MPAFWIKQDANPGQLHETWAKVDRPGVYFGQCSELCGARHGFMPIAIEVGAAGAVRAMGRVEGRAHAGRRAARQPPRLAGRGDRRPRRSRSRPTPGGVKQPATNQAATAQN